MIIKAVEAPEAKDGAAPSAGVGLSEGPTETDLVGKRAV